MFIDFHTHLDFYKDDEIEKVIEDIENNNIQVINCSTNIEKYNQNINTFSSKNIINTFGIHPWEVKDNKYDIDILEELIMKTPMIGEIGLDFFWEEDKSTYHNQIKVLESILEINKKYNKYINIHTKGAEELVCKLLNKYKISERTIIHWYSGDYDTLKKLIDMKCYFTCSVDIRYSEKTRQIINMIDKEKLLAETDGPTALEWVNGNYAMPSEIIDVYKNICDVKNIELDDFRYNCKKTLKEMIYI